MSKVVSLRLRDDQADRLGRAARSLGRSPTETAALLLEEALRQREFALIQFRDSPVGRQAYLQGSRLTVWQVVASIREMNGALEQVAAELEIPLTYVAAAQRYADQYREEIEAAITDSAQTVDVLAQLMPQLRVVAVDATTPRCAPSYGRWWLFINPHEFRQCDHHYPFSEPASRPRTK